MSRDGVDDDAAALTWGDESDASLVTGPPASASASTRDTDEVTTAPRNVAGSVLLVFYGITAGVYLLYTVGWVLGALADTTPTVSVFAQLMHEFGLFCAIAAPALWVLAVFVLAKRPVSRVLGLLLGMVLLVPWPFVLGAFQ